MVVGVLKHCVVHYDRSGHFSGTTEVVFTKKSDAIVVVKLYNNVQLDGKPMMIELIGTNLDLPISVWVNVIRTSVGRGRRTIVMAPNRGCGRSQARGDYIRRKSQPQAMKVADVGGDNRSSNKGEARTRSRNPGTSSDAPDGKRDEIAMGQIVRLSMEVTISEQVKTRMSTGFK
eukprot:Gb_00741 [translate_table: standard]